MHSPPVLIGRRIFAAPTIYAGRMVRKSMRLLLALPALLLVLALTHHLWLPPIGGFLIVHDQLRPASAVAPLAGESEIRARYANELWQQQYARWFAITNAASADNWHINRVRGKALEAGVPPGRILITALPVANTYEEAIALRQLAQEQMWDSLIVITSPYHTWRTRMIFRDVFADTEILVMVVPVERHWYTADSWWQTRKGWLATALEYIKIVAYKAGYRSSR